MDRKFALPVGFAVVALLAVVGMLSLLSFTAAQPIEASNLDASNFTLGEIDTEIFNPIVATTAVSGTYAVTNSPTKALALATYTLTFQAPNNNLVNGTDEIIVTFSDDFTDIDFPTSIATSAVSIRAIGTGDGCAASGTEVDTCGVTGDKGNEGEAVAPEAITIDTVGIKSKPQVRLRIPDMDTDDDSGGNGIKKNANVTVVFRQVAGIYNPKEVGEYDIDVRTTDAGGVDGTSTQDSTDEIWVQGRILADSDDGKRGDELTLVATGVEGKEGITFFRDGNGDGIRQSTETDLCVTTADGDAVATCTFVIGNPPMVPDTYVSDTKSGSLLNEDLDASETAIDVDDGTDFAKTQIIKVDSEKMLISSISSNTLTVTRGVLSTTAATHSDNAIVYEAGSCTISYMWNCNFINFVDSMNRSTTGAGAEAIDQIAINRQTFELDQTITASPNEGHVGDKITISMFDWPVSTDVTKIELGTIEVDLPSTTPNTGDSGEVSWTFTIPGLGKDDETRIPTGKLPLKVTATENEDVNITVLGAKLNIAGGATTILANQDLTISGSGFTEGGSVCILQGDITLANVKLEIDDADDCDLTGKDGVEISDGGTFTLTVRIHDAASSTAVNTALLSEGPIELKVMDSSKSEGTLALNIAERSLVVNPVSARPRDTVTIIGKAFIADNADGVSTSVNLEYTCGSTTRKVTADPDVSGNFRESLRIPSACTIPATNTITAKIHDGDGATGVVETITHDIPDALVSIAPGRGASGSSVTVSGVGFRTYESVGKIEFGGLGTLGGRTVNTDSNGNFTVDDVVIPGLDPGVHAVKVEVGSGSTKTTSSTSFEVLESGVAGTATAMDDVYALSDNLLRIFRFNNDTKVWAFNDKRPEFADANTLGEVNTGGVYWILIDQDATIDVGGSDIGLTCTGDDCWNLVVWP
jgi:hypothetical protein